MSGKPYQSCLIPYEKEIVALRRCKPPVSYSRIMAVLKEKYQITIGGEGVRAFIKRRAKSHKICNHAWRIELSEADGHAAAKPPSLRNQTASSTAKPVAANKSKPSVSSQIKDFNMPFSENYNLHILSPEAAAALQKQLEEENP